MKKKKKKKKIKQIHDELIQMAPINVNVSYYEVTVAVYDHLRTT